MTDLKIAAERTKRVGRWLRGVVIRLLDHEYSRHPMVLGFIGGLVGIVVVPYVSTNYRVLREEASKREAIREELVQFAKVTLSGLRILDQTRCLASGGCSNAKRDPQLRLQLSDRNQTVINEIHDKDLVLQAHIEFTFRCKDPGKKYETYRKFLHSTINHMTGMNSIEHANAWAVYQSSAMNHWNAIAASMDNEIRSYRKCSLRSLFGFNCKHYDHP